MSIKLSIIIPHYNSPVLLRKLLNSIPLSNEIEVIVVDDKSKKNLDEYEKIIKDNNFSHIIFLNNDSGVKSAGTCRNIGMKQAVGKWFLFADSDDFFTKDLLFNVKKYFESEHDIVFFKIASINLDTNEESDRHLFYNTLIEKYNKNMKNSDIELKYKYYPPWSKLYSRRIIEEYQIQFDEVLSSNDLMFTTKAGHFSIKLKTDESVIYCVTRTGESLTSKITRDNLLSRVYVYADYYIFLKKHLDTRTFLEMKLSGSYYISVAKKMKHRIVLILKIMFFFIRKGVKFN